MVAMDLEEAHKLSMFFLPYMASGHMIPMLDMAKLFAKRGVKVTIITTPSNASLVKTTIQRVSESTHHPITLLILPVPSSAEASLPNGWDCSSSIGFLDFYRVQDTISLLQRPLDLLLREHSPNCIVSDMFFPWTADIADDLGIPRLVFHGMSYFAQCVMNSIKRHKPHEMVSDDTEPFVVPGLAPGVELTRSQLPVPLRFQTEFKGLMERMGASQLRSYGVVMNSFYELEPYYVDSYRNLFGKKAWHVGPVSLCNTEVEDQVERGAKASTESRGCMDWLDSKKPDSVLFICFGSLSGFSAAQLREIALGLVESRQQFIWVVKNDCPNTSEWLADGLEERIMEGKGFIIRGWAPQILILNHEAVGGFMTHCGWNSVLEGVSAGVPMITWPIFGDQPLNEKLVVDVLEIGVRIGVKIATPEKKEVFVERGEIEKVVVKLMDGGEEVKALRKRARMLREMANVALEEGGSSHIDISHLIQELIDLQK